MDERVETPVTYIWVQMGYALSAHPPFAVAPTLYPVAPGQSMQESTGTLAFQYSILRRLRCTGK